GYIAQNLGHCAPRYGHAFTVQQPGIEQQLHDLGHAARTMKVDREIVPAGLEVAEDRHLAAHALEVVDAPFDVGGVGNGQKMQHGIGRPAHGHDYRHRVFDGFARDDVARLEVA